MIIDFGALAHNPYVQTIVGYWLLAMLAQTMPVPQADSGTAYRWLFAILQWSMANWTKLLQAVPPVFPAPLKAAAPPNEGETH